MIRYCLTEGHRLLPCGVGWEGIDSSGCSFCYDEPQEKNCHNLVNEHSRQKCPYCGNYLKRKREYPFGQNIRDAISTIKG